MKLDNALPCVTCGHIPRVYEAGANDFTDLTVACECTKKTYPFTKLKNFEDKQKRLLVIKRDWNRMNAPDRPKLVEDAEKEIYGILLRLQESAHINLLCVDVIIHDSSSVGAGKETTVSGVEISYNNK